MNPKFKAHRKALANAEQAAQRKKKKTIQKWLTDWYEGRQDYPVTKTKRKKLTWSQWKKLLKK
jgi:hypothetical protein